MCNTCGCSVTGGNAHLLQEHAALEFSSAGTANIEVLSSLLDANNHMAEHNREHLAKHGVLAINLMSSPGSGKTSLLEATLDRMARDPAWKDVAVGVIEGDLETENDALRIRAKNVPAIQITTGQACHLDAHLIHDALHELDLDRIDLLFIENVGNLVCPASFDLGHHLNVTLLSVTEGDDKPSKYPVMFRAADLVLLSKTDYLSFIDDFSVARAHQNIRALANPAPILEVSSKQPESLEEWMTWLKEKRTELSGGVRFHPNMQSDTIALHGFASP